MTEHICSNDPQELYDQYSHVVASNLLVGTSMHAGVDAKYCLCVMTQEAILHPGMIDELDNLNLGVQYMGTESGDTAMHEWVLLRR